MLLGPSDELRGQAAEIYAAVAARLRRHDVPGELLHVGGTSVSGAVTLGDVDLHLRTDPAEFSGAVSVLQTMFAVTKPEIWCATLATFTIEAPLPTGLAVTPAGSEHDLRFTRTWALLAADPALVRAYNLVKQQAGPESYEDEKSRFFDRVLTLWPDDDPAPS